jgi:Flp pilus assembly protein TadG
MCVASVYFMLVAVYLCLLVYLVFSWWLIMLNSHNVQEVLDPVYKYTILYHCSGLTMAISVATQDRLPLRRMKHILSTL